VEVVHSQRTTPVNRVNGLSIKILSHRRRQRDFRTTGPFTTLRRRGASLAMATSSLAGAAAATTNNSIGKEAIVWAGKPEMLAQRRPFVIAAKQATALQLGNDMRDEIL
jgi:hypothetical protein